VTVVTCMHLLPFWYASTRDVCLIVLRQEFIDKCEMLIDNEGLREQLQLNAQQFLEEHHSTQHEKQQYINVISELIHVAEI